MFPRMEEGVGDSHEKGECTFEYHGYARAGCRWRRWSSRGEHPPRRRSLLGVGYNAEPDGIGQRTPDLDVWLDDREDSSTVTCTVTVTKDAAWRYASTCAVGSGRISSDPHRPGRELHCHAEVTEWMAGSPNSLFRSVNRRRELRVLSMGNFSQFSSTQTVGGWLASQKGGGTV